MHVYTRQFWGDWLSRLSSLCPPAYQHTSSIYKQVHLTLPHPSPYQQQQQQQSLCNSVYKYSIYIYVACRMSMHRTSCVHHDEKREKGHKQKPADTTCRWPLSLSNINFIIQLGRNKKKNSVHAILKYLYRIYICLHVQ